MRMDRQYIPIVVLLITALLVFGAFIVVNLTNRGDDGDIVQTQEATAEATEPVVDAQTTDEASAGAPGVSTDEATGQGDSGSESAPTVSAVEGTPTPTSRSRATDSRLIGTQVTPVLHSTAVPPESSGGTTTPTSMSRSDRSILIGTHVTPVLQSTTAPGDSGGTTTPTSLSRVTQSIRLDAQISATPVETTPEATAETTEQAQGAGGNTAGGTPPPADSGLPFADRNDVPSVLEPRGPVAAQQASLWWIMLGIGSVVYIAVMLMVLRIVSQRRREREYIPSNRKVLGLIVGGGVIVPIIVLTLLFVLTLGTMAVLALNDTPTELTIEVVGWQWWWEVRYPDQGVLTANEIHIPVGERVRFQLTSGDVIHSFWVPELGGKMDLMAGRVNEFWLEADRPGEYRGQCAEFCGRQHAKMAILVIAHDRADFEAWVASQQGGAHTPDSDLVARGQEIFLNSPCIACHAVEGTTAQGVQGPDLTHFGSRRTLGAGAAPNTEHFLAEWIVNSQSIKPGNLMPPQDIAAEDLPALIAYLHSLE